MCSIQILGLRPDVDNFSNFASRLLFSKTYENIALPPKKGTPTPLGWQMLANFASRVVFWNWGRSKFGRGTSSYKAKGSKTWTSLASVPGASFTFWISEFFFQKVDGWDIFFHDFLEGWLDSLWRHHYSAGCRKNGCYSRLCPFIWPATIPWTANAKATGHLKGWDTPTGEQPHRGIGWKREGFCWYLRWSSGQRFPFCWCYRNCRLATIRESPPKQNRSKQFSQTFISSFQNCTWILLNVFQTIGSIELASLLEFHWT